MARGVDELVDHVLSEVALTGVQGAGSNDFKRFVQSFYEKTHVEDGSSAQLALNQLSPTFYEKVWQWVIGHTDIRITHNGESRQYTLAEFEAAEQPGKASNGTIPTAQPAHSTITLNRMSGPAKSLLTLRDSLRQRLTTEELGPRATAALRCAHVQESPSLESTAPERQSDHGRVHYAPRRPRILPAIADDVETVFDDSPTDNIAPRLYASQSRIWQALTGHGIDLKKVPTMEFVLLSLIASHGVAGVTQPELTVLSGQDKRSVPHRTDELYRKGYIEKRPVQSGKLRTSLCVHKNFISADHFLTSGKVEDVFQFKKFVLSGFVHLLYNTLKDAGVVPTRDIRKRLNVPMSTWNKRAVQGALIRLDQTGMVKRFRARRKDTEDTWLTCIEVLREPRPEDHDNLKFRRQAPVDEATDEQSDEDVDGDTLMRDLEVDILNSSAQEGDANKEDFDRIPPQWVPERLLSNTLYEMVAVSGSNGCDTEALRDRIVGKFWRRPMESYLSRLTDDWEATQPAPLRHLAIIRDTRNTQEKKFVHYVYRTYGDFQKGVDAGEVIWAGVSKPAPKQSSTAKGGRPKKDACNASPIDLWGFRTVSPKDFLNDDGSGSLSECRTAIVHGRKYGPRWDNSLVDDIGYQKMETPKPERTRETIGKSRSKGKPKASLNVSSLVTPMSDGSPVTPLRQTPSADAGTDSEDGTPMTVTKVMGLPKRKYEAGLLTIDQRIALGLKPKGRLSKLVEDQIREHRNRTGDPVSIPDSVEVERPVGTPASVKNSPLMTKEERIAAGLPPRGRLGQKIEDQIREQRGLPKSTEKIKKPRKNRPANEPALLSKEQRVRLGIIPHGRLPQSLMEGLREERDFDITLEQSRVIQAYLSAVNDKQSKAEITRAIDEVREQTMQQHEPGRGLNQADSDALVPSGADEPVEAASPAMNKPGAEKRKANGRTTILQHFKRLRAERDTLAEVNGELMLTTPPRVPVDVDEPSEEQAEQSDFSTPGMETRVEPVVPSPRDHSSRRPTPPIQDHPQVVNLIEVDAKVRLIKETYSNRSSPGLYTNPFAKRRIGQGRPRNAFIATFRLERLSNFEWFAEDATNSDSQPDSRLNATSADAEREVGMERQSTESNPGGTDKEVVLQAADDTTTASNPDMPTSEVFDVRLVTPSTVHMDDAADVKQSPDPSLLPGQSQTLRDSSINAENIGKQAQNDAHLVQQTTRPVAGWTAINNPAQLLPSYKSPYAPSDNLQSSSTDGPQPEDIVTEQTAQDSADKSPIQGVCGPITEVDTLNRNARKLAAFMGTKTGGGSQKMFRHKIIMQIIELCDGAYPMHGEIGRPFITLWKQQYPNVPPPNSSTVLSNLRDMIADPRNGLKKFSFLIRLRQSAGLKKKDMVVYQHLTPTSPQVTRLAYKMANDSNTKAHQYYPEEIRHLVSDESFYVPLPIAPKDETVTLERLNPSLQHKIKEANLERRRRYYHKQKNEEFARDAQNAAVEAPLKQSVTTNGQPRVKRTRLASLNDKNKRYRRAPFADAPSGPLDPNFEEPITEDVATPENEQENRRTLNWKEPIVPAVVRHHNIRSLPERQTHGQAVQEDTLVEYCIPSFTAPLVRFYATNGTFSTEFGLVRGRDLLDAPKPPPKVSSDQNAKHNQKKRVRIVEPASDRSSKKARLGEPETANIVKANIVLSPVEESEDSHSSSSSLSSSSSSEEDDIPPIRLSKLHAKAKNKAKAKAKAKAIQRGINQDSSPTLLERLTGLTGDPNDPIYFPPKPKAQPQKLYEGWSERKRARFNKQQRERKYVESQDPIDKFKKLCCTLTIASSMAGDNAHVDWAIVEKVHNSTSFDLAKTKVLWAWMQENMALHIVQQQRDFENRFLEAYVNNTVAAIEDPATYDWANLVRWAMHNCVYPEISLPVYREALRHFIVDLSSFDALDRPKWYRERIADRVRTQILLQCTFTLPMVQSRAVRAPVNQMELKARSWIRANTATPQALYNSRTAHEKLQTLGNTILSKVVGEYVDRQMLRMRKLKRLLPGRNYTFTARLAKKYGRAFELSDFMAAVEVKKKMDAAFLQQDPRRHVYSVSRAEPDGAIMAIISLLGAGKVKFAPQVPSVDNEFGAPLPRLSVWGFMEGDYVHRGIDRQRLFWDIYVVPTESYDYGNPLRPTITPPIGESDSLAAWSPLPQPPLPGKHDSNALLPIWSSIDGQNVTWPWWYRILNLVLQPLIFQPGATFEDILVNCDEYTIELFEIELALKWLISVNAVIETPGGGYVTQPCVWAAFGDVLYDLEDDWLNSHVKRRRQKHEKQQWREQYHLRYYSTLTSRSAKQSTADNSDESDTPTEDERIAAATTRTTITRRPNEQYAIVRKQIATTKPELSDARLATKNVEHTPQLVTK